MSQSGYTPIQLYRTTTASATPSAGNLSAGELAINLTDEKLFFKNASGTVKVLASTGAGNAGGSNTQVQYNSSGVLTGSSSFVFDGTNVGIGAASPQRPLHAAYLSSNVGAYTAIFQGQTGGYGAGVSFQSNLSGGSLAEMARITADGEAAWNTTASTQDAGLRFYTALDGTVAEKMRLNSDGNLGIGITSISYKLEVGGDVRIAGGGGDLRIQSATGTTTSGGDSVIYNDANDLIFGTGTTTTQRMRIDSSGNVIIAGGTPTVGGLNVAIGTQSTGQQVISSTTALGASHLGANLLVVTSGITLTLPTSAISGKTIMIANASSGDITLSYTGSLGTDGPTTVAAGTSLQLISDGGAPPFWRLFIPSGGFDGTTLYAPGYKDIPINQRTSTYTLALSDRGKNVFATAGSFTITVPANASVAFPIGTAISIFCGDATKTLAPAAGVTLIQAGTSNTGSRTLAINAMVTLVKLQTNTWVVSGAGLS